MQQQSFSHCSLIQIKHRKTQAYLKGTIHPIQDDLQFVGGTEVNDGVYNYWVIEKVYPFTSDIIYGDLVYLKNFATQLYLNCKSDQKSDVTKQSLICLSEQPDPFLLQSAKDNYNSDKKIQLLLNSSTLRIINAINGRSLHSHDIKYKNKNVKNYFEITGFHERDDNDLFEILPVSANDQETIANYKMPQIEYKEQLIKDGNTVTIRNWWSGQSLHSHDIKYKSTQTQEVTAKTMTRDDNDEWKIFQQIESASILSGVGLQFKHVKTNNYLAHLDNNKTKSKQGLQVCCIEKIPKQCWMIITLDSNPVKFDAPFFIFNPALDVYLAHLPNPSEQSTFQQEIALVPNINGQCIWLIENIIK